MDGFIVQEPVAALRDHHRIDDEVGQLERFHRRGDGLDEQRVGQHAGLDRIAAEIGGHRFDLQRQEIIRYDVHGADADGVLRGERRDRRGAVHTVSREGFEIRLNPGAAA